MLLAAIRPVAAAETNTTPIHASLLPSDDALLETMGHAAFQYFWDHADATTGLIADSSLPGAPASIAAVGFGLAALCVGHHRGWVSREEAYQRILTVLKSVKTRLACEHGFYYHFVDTHTGARAWGSEISSIDTAIFLSGVLFAAEYFQGTDVERLGTWLYERTDWRWMMNGTPLLCMGWKPEGGFLTLYWDWYNEGMLLYALAIGSPTFPIPPSSWQAWKRAQGTYGGHTVIYSYFGSLFTYEYPHAWIDFRSLYDGSISYWQNSVEATLANLQFCLDHAREHQAYAQGYWGLTAGESPDGYRAYGAEPAEVVLHDGTIHPYGMVAALPFAPDVALTAIRTLHARYGDQLYGEYGFRSGFNLDRQWWSHTYLGVDLGVSLLMVENFRSELIWTHFMRVPAIQRWVLACLSTTPTTP